jgi:pimeloyl-ACP methyl ester carboxylesterase
MLFERGHNVLIPRLPHHGHRDRMTTALARLTQDDLKRSALEACEAARGLGERVEVVGFSTGGTMAAWLAQTQPISNAVIVAPFLGSMWLHRRLATPVARLTLRAPNAFPWWDPVKRGALRPEHGYPRYSTHAAARVYLLGRETMELARAAVPLAERIVLVLNPREHTVNNAAVGELFRRWESRRARVELVRLTGLPRSHDIIEPERRVDPVKRVYPRLLDILEATGR